MPIDLTVYMKMIELLAIFMFLTAGSTVVWALYTIFHMEG